MVEFPFQSVAQVDAEIYYCEYWKQGAWWKCPESLELAVTGEDISDTVLSLALCCHLPGPDVPATGPGWCLHQLCAPTSLCEVAGVQGDTSWGQTPAPVWSCSWKTRKKIVLFFIA